MDIDVLQSVYAYAMIDGVGVTAEVEAAAQLFKALGNPSRLWLLQLLTEAPHPVSALAQAARMSQPLVSQHLRTPRQAGLVATVRSGKEVVYHLADQHVANLIADALAHAQEPVGLGLHHESEGDS